MEPSADRGQKEAPEGANQPGLNFQLSTQGSAILMSKLKLSRIAVATSVTLCALGAAAQTQSPTIGNGGGSIDQQIIGDTIATADRTQSAANQIGNAANQFGNDLGNNVDTRDQNTVTSTGGAATGGTAIGNQSDNRSSASNGPQTMGQANTGTVGNLTTGPSTSNSGGNITGGNTMNGGANTATGGAGGAGGQGGAGGLAAQGQQQANTGTNAQGQGQSSANRNSQTTTAGNGAGASAGAGAGAGAGSGNRTANTTSVDASDRSDRSTTYTSKTVVWAPVVHGPGAAPLAAAGMAVVTGTCGPIKVIESSPVIGKRFGIWGGISDVEQGTTDRAVIPTDKDGNPIPGYRQFEVRNGIAYGVRVVRALSVLGTSSGASLSLGGFGKDGQALQGGGAASGQLQQIAVHAWTEECEAYKIASIEAPKPAAAPVVFTPAPRADRN